ncbi:MAG: hypothetical protein ABTS16_15570 [Candidatus Accumulibacter phosphatis]|jgi:hypothetical protein|uniref:Uncharacterized protein n=1 Tax=Candidatus Accumulibacter contiguus TaxID=2954381 RepID=A0ABX1T6L3_9PROT|nr:hypothetical protein [Candidatus Accumulibacter contiguus]NMQ04215.1 hypothetical protein [Candidatus Accumulibacter contiguus]
MPKHRFPALLLAAFLLQPAALWAEEPQPPAAGSSATVSVEQLRDLAGQVASAKNWKAVVEYASRLLAQQLDGLPSLLIRGQTLGELGQDESTLADSQRAVALDSNSALAWGNLC